MKDNYEICALLEVGNAGSTIQADKTGFVDEMSGVEGPNSLALQDE